jgi:hypothetical protein
MAKKSALEAKQDAVLDILDEDFGDSQPIKTAKEAVDELKPAMQYKSAMDKEREETKKRASEPKNAAIQDMDQPRPEKLPRVGKTVLYFVKQYDNQGRSILEERAALVTAVLKNDDMRRVCGINIAHFTPRGDLHPRHQVHYSPFPEEGKWTWPKDE